MSGNTGMFNGQPLIRVQDLGKSFGSIDVLKGITVDIHKGDVVFVVGPSGSGKSTFLRCLNLLEEPTSGHIFFEGTDITDPKTDIDKHRQKMGMVFQQFNLFPHMDIMEPGSAFGWQTGPLVTQVVDVVEDRPWSYWSVWDWQTGPTHIPASFQAVRNSVLPLSGLCA